MTIIRDDHEEKGFLPQEVERLHEKIRQLVDGEVELRSILEEMALSESRLRHIIDDHTDFICRFLPGGAITFANRAVCDYIGKPPEDLIGESYYTLTPQEDLEKLQGQISSLTAGNPVFSIVHRVSISEGKTRCHQWTYRAIFDRQGQFIEYQAVGRDITPLMEAEETLRRSEEKHRTVLDNATDGIYKVDCHGYFTYMNSVLLKRYNLRPDNYHTIHFLDLAPPMRIKIFAPGSNSSYWERRIRLTN